MACDPPNHIGPVVICAIPSSDPWTAHLTRRLDEAMEVRLISARTPLQSAKVFVPTGVNQIDFANSNPSDSLRVLLREPTPRAGWVRRSDLCEEVAEWLSAKYEGNLRAALFCEAGWSEAGDAHLSKRPHVMVEGRPLLNTRVGVDDVQLVAQVLRWGRGLRFLGVVVEPLVGDFTLASDGLFICDAYDGDSFATMPLVR
jgi:hypothetical protein